MKSTTRRPVCRALDLSDITTRELERIGARITVTADGHWRCHRNRLRNGYAYMHLRGEMRGLHRIIECLKTGYLPDGHDVHHKDCCRPECLYRMPYQLHRRMTLWEFSYTRQPEV